MSAHSPAVQAREKEPASERDLERRAEIIQTAETLFRDIGLHKTTVADIARALRMSPANVYRFFSSKAEIQEAVAAHVMGEVEGAIREIAIRDESAESRLRAIVGALQAVNAERLMRDSKLHEMVEVALNERWPIIADHVARTRSLYAALIADGIRRSEFAACDAYHAAGLFQAATVVFVHPRMMVECAPLSLPSASDMIDLLMKALRTPA